MQAVAEANARVTDPVYHIAISWPPGEVPTDDEAFATARHHMRAVGMAGHQYLAAIHHDTECTHVHLMVNRVHPDSYRVTSPHRDYLDLSQASREMELRYGWQRVKGAYTVQVDEDGNTVVRKAKAGDDRGSDSDEVDTPLDQHSDRESFIAYAKEQLRKTLRGILEHPRADWQSLHRDLHKLGIRLEPYKRGFTLLPVGMDDPRIKASSVDTRLGKGQLEKRFGAWVAAEASPAPDSKVVEPTGHPLVASKLKVAMIRALKDPHVTWETLHGEVRALGATLQRKGQGLVVSNGVDEIKASAIHESLSLIRLVRKLGEFREAPPLPEGYDPRAPQAEADAKRAAAREARKLERDRLWGDYQAYRKSIPKVDMRSASKDAFAQLRASQAEERQRIKASDVPAPEKRGLYSLLAAQGQLRRQSLRESLTRDAEWVRETAKPKDYRTWVKSRAEQGDEAALRLLRGWGYSDRRSQGRNEAERTLGDSIDDGAPVQPKRSPRAEAMAYSITEVIIILRDLRHVVHTDGSVTYYLGTGAAFHDRGRYLSMASPQLSDDALIAAMMMAGEKFGGGLRLKGSDEFVTRCIELIAQHKLNLTLRDDAQAAQIPASAPAPKPPSPVAP